MIITKITPIVNKTASLLNIDPTLVQLTIGSILKQTKEYIENPTHAGLRIRYFGVFRPYSPALTYHLKKLIRDLRDPTKASLHPTIKEEFRKFWSLRKLLQKDNERRNFKRRFGS